MELKSLFICIFKCEDKTFYWGPFNTQEEAQNYSQKAKDQAEEYYGKDNAWKRKISELTPPII